MKRTMQNSDQANLSTGFTLIELLVVIMVIMALLGIGVSFGPQIMDIGNVKLTKTTLANAQLILDEYVLMGGSISDFRTEKDGTRDFVNRTRNIKALKKYYGGFAKEVYGMDTNNDGAIDIHTIKDAWGRELYYIPAGENVENQPIRSSPYFASPGPDGQWGDSRYAYDSPYRLKAQDNLYSFDVTR